MTELLPTATRLRGTLAELVRPHRVLAFGAFAVLLGATATGLATAPLLGHIVDLVVAHGSVAVPVVLLVIVAVARGALQAAGQTLVARVGESMLATLREQFVSRALGLPLSTVEKAGAGDLTARVTGDVSVIAKAVREGLPELGGSALTIVLTFGGLALLDWRFLLAALLAAPIQLYTVRWYGRRAVPVYAEQRVAVGAQQQQLLDTIGGARTVRAFGLADRQLRQVTERSVSAISLTLRGIGLITRFFARLNLAEFVGLAAMLAMGFLLVENGSVSVGTATAAALYFHSLFTPINSALALIDDAQQAAASLARLVGVAELRPPDEGTAVPLDGSIKVAGVHHAYVAGTPVLRDVELSVQPGERVALVGASGAGKTTLARLIAGVHRPSMGAILVGGMPLAELDRRSVALVSQEVHVFAGRLSDDLRLARPEATDDELREALATVNALTWAEKLPSGLSTVVGDGGHRLTAAQSQQLALARLVLADPPVAILDEATAEAGSAGAKALEAAADAALAGRTALIIAHRLTQAAQADRVVVLEDGRIVESGTHAELATNGGRYAQLWSAWAQSRDET
ncbi:ABC transporter ATP-binding protein [Amycolatopsis sp.]|uniref:ABC transporter ATP-binding protein n=1 Tax=Amycolatopsis sp. TaxID=37632 RepID=UPI002BBE7011|nr:ABC transporter ATP-binding protein [Amycolatopsis sp.]HVV14347.1 ABC transporter ATP-binding protein [Amycolatopsis sp.]